jgi:hypothetical protein
MSATQAGVLFTVNDAGNAPILFATTVTGADRGAWRVRGARNVDWEALAPGPCSAGAGQRRCLYIGDTGDNDARYPTRAIYRVPEPAAANRPGPVQDTPAVDSLTYVYPDGPQDVEAMYVAPDGAVYLITKRPREGRAGSLRPALVYRVPASAWTRATSRRVPAEAELVDSLPAIVPGSASHRLVTDAALSSDGRELAVRTYRQLFVFPTDARTGRVRPGVAPRVCDLAPLREKQGEGVTWLGADSLVLTSEGRGAPIHVVACPARGRSGQ